MYFYVLICTSCTFMIPVWPLKVLRSVSWKSMAPATAFVPFFPEYRTDYLLCSNKRQCLEKCWQLNSPGSHWLSMYGQKIKIVNGNWNCLVILHTIVDDTQKSLLQVWTWEWVNDDRRFILGWTVPLTHSLSTICRSQLTLIFLDLLRNCNLKSLYDQMFGLWLFQTTEHFSVSYLEIYPFQIYSGREAILLILRYCKC